MVRMCEVRVTVGKGVLREEMNRCSKRWEGRVR